MFFLRQSTSVDVAIGPFLDNVDGFTEEGGLTITQADIRLKKNDTAWAQKNAAQTLTHEENGWYELTLDATDTNTVGRLVVHIDETGALPVWQEFTVLEEAIYDALFAASAAAFDANQDVTVGSIAAGAITAAAIATDAIDADAIAANAIDSGAIASGAITAAKFAAGAIDATAIATGAIDADALAADAVAEIRAVASGTSDSGSTTTMVDAARTEADTDYWKGNFILFTSGVIAGQCRLITAFTPGTDTITFAPSTTQAVGTQTYEILPSGRVDLQLWLGTVVNALISGRVDSNPGAIQADVITAAAIAANAIGSSEIADGAITAAKVATDAIDADALADNAITAGTFAADSITAAKIAADVSTEINAGVLAVLGALADAAADGDPTSSDTVMAYVKQLINTLVGTTGIPTFPAAADAANNVSLSEVIRQTNSDLNDIQTRLPAALVSGRIDADVGAISGDSTAADRLEALMDGIIVAAVNGVASTTSIPADGFTEATNDHFNGRLITFISGALNGQQTDITDYVGSTQTFTVTALTEAPADNDLFVIH